MSTSRFDVRTHRRSEMVDITSLVQRALEDSHVQNGLATVWVPHTTAGVSVNENADPDVVHDVLEALDRFVPWQQDYFDHAEGNSAAHVKSSLMGCSTNVPVSGGRMLLGTWQAIYLCEFDGPRTRQVIVTVVGQ